MKADSIISRLKEISDPERAEVSQRFFKTGPGEYGEGDVFIGIRNPVLRKEAKKVYKELSLGELQKLMDSEIHEVRLFGLFVLVIKFEREKDEEQKRAIFNFYRENTHRINNWDLVDCSVHQIVGGWLIDKPKDQLYEWVESDLLWERRIAMVSTWHFIRNKELDDTFKLAELLLDDEHDLMHKAVGWMLREAGKKDMDRLKKFLRTHYSDIPRTALRYAIERFPEEERQVYLKGEFGKAENGIF